METKNKKMEVELQLTEYQKQFLLEYFKEMRTEINLRVKNHTSLVWAKIVSTGVLMSFLLVQNIDPIIKVSGLTFVPVIAILYDIMITQNIKAIHKIGHFIRDQFENVVFPEFDLWEHYAGQKNVKERNYGYVDLFLLVAFTFGTMLITFYLLWIQGNSQFAMLFAIVSLVVIVWLIRFMQRYILFFAKPKKTDSAKGYHDANITYR